MVSLPLVLALLAAAAFGFTVAALLAASRDREDARSRSGLLMMAPGYALVCPRCRGWFPAELGLPGRTPEPRQGPQVAVQGPEKDVEAFLAGVRTTEAPGGAAVTFEPGPVSTAPKSAGGPVA